MRISDWSSDVCSSDLCMRADAAADEVIARIVEPCDRGGGAPFAREARAPVGIGGCAEAQIADTDRARFQHACPGARKLEALQDLCKRFGATLQRRALMR